MKDPESYPMINPANNRPFGVIVFMNKTTGRVSVGRYEALNEEMLHFAAIEAFHKSITRKGFFEAFQFICCTQGEFAWGNAAEEGEENGSNN